jgi:hypothetical protein
MANWKKFKKFVQKVAKPVALVASIVYPPLIPMIGSTLGATTAASAAIVGAAALSGGASALAGDSTQDIVKNALLGGVTAGVTQAVSPTAFDSGLFSSAPAGNASALTNAGMSGQSAQVASAAANKVATEAALNTAVAAGGGLVPSTAGFMSPSLISAAGGATNLGVSAVGAAAPAATSTAGGLMGSTLPATAGTGAAAAAGGTGLLDFAKQNPQLTGAAIGALTGAIDAANAPKEQTTTTSIDPDIKREYMANLERAKATAANLGVRQFAGFTDDYGLAEAQLKNLGLGGKGQQTTDEAALRARFESVFMPDQIAAAQANRGAVQDVSGQLGSQYMGAYFNPYEEQVVQGTLGDIERSRQMQDIADRARATQARAFGGSRQGVQSALTNEAALRQAGTTAAGLRQAGFSQAAQFGQSDAARQLQAQMANQGVSLTLEQANAQLRQQAALANQQAGISGAGLRQSAIGQLGQLGAQQQNLGMSGANAVMLAQMERQKLEQQRLDAQRNLELERLGITSGALGLQPARTGETSTQPLYSSGIGSALSGGLTGAYIGSLLQPKKA